MADLVILWNKNTVCIECRISGEILYATALYVLEVTQVKISCHGWMTYDNTATGDQSRILAPALPFFGEPPWFVAPTDWALYRPWTKKVSNISLVNGVERQAQEFAEWGNEKNYREKRLLHPKSKRWGIHAVIAHCIIFLAHEYAKWGIYRDLQRENSVRTEVEKMRHPIFSFESNSPKF